MTIVDITFGRAFRVWWSYAWRGILLSLPVFIPFQIFMLTWVLPHVHAADAGHDIPQAREVLFVVGIVVPIVLAGVMVLLATAMRWTLRSARWADFKLIASSIDGPSG